MHPASAINPVIVCYYLSYCSLAFAILISQWRQSWSRPEVGK